MGLLKIGGTYGRGGALVCLPFSRAGQVRRERKVGQLSVSSSPKGMPVRYALYIGLMILTACGGAGAGRGDPSPDSELNVSDVYVAKDLGSASMIISIDGRTLELGIFRTYFASPSVATITEHASNTIAQERESMNEPGVFVRIHAFTERGETSGTARIENGDTQYEYEGPFDLDGSHMSVEGQFTKAVKEPDGKYRPVGQVDGSISATC